MIVLATAAAAVGAAAIVLFATARLVGLRPPTEAEPEDAWEVMRVRVLSLEIAARNARRENEVLQAEVRRAKTRVAALEAANRSAGYRISAA